jgi:hypothetical protein
MLIKALMVGLIWEKINLLYFLIIQAMFKLFLPRKKKNRLLFLDNQCLDSMQHLNHQCMWVWSMEQVNLTMVRKRKAKRRRRYLNNNSLNLLCFSLVEMVQWTIIKLTLWWRARVSTSKSLILKGSKNHFISKVM